MSSKEGRYRIGIDTGGTFVDAVELDEITLRFRIAKAPTTPKDPAIGVLNALQKLGTPLEQTHMIIHGTTLGVNSIIQRKGAVTGLIVNEGFRDVFEIGRGDVPPQYIYDFNYYKRLDFVKRRNIVGVPCRVNYRGEEVKQLDVDALKAGLKHLVEEHGVESIAICFLHSYRNPIHEEVAARIASESYPNLTVSASCDVVREYREYERMSTTILDAYIKPIVSRYLLRLKQSLAERGFKGRLLIMRSDGGVMTAETAAKTPLSTVQSGPAGGVIGATYYAKAFGLSRLITMDIGGTSLDVCVLDDGVAGTIHQSQIEHYPILLTMYDIRSIGAGGGSIASVHSGLLKVGPESAGAEPGPMCYNKGGLKPTITDAAICLGYIDPNRFLSGDMVLIPELSFRGVMEQIAEPLGLGLIEAAAGIFKVAVTNSIGAIRAITVEEGRDPSDYTLLAYGGAGPLLASIIAHELRIPRVVVPTMPAAFSAWGMLMADIVYDRSQTFLSLLEEVSLKDLEDVYSQLEVKVLDALFEQGVHKDSVNLLRSIELRYLGQEHTIEVFLSSLSSTQEIRAEFDRQHYKRYGHKMNDPVQTVNLRVRGSGILPKPQIPKLAAEVKEDSLVGSRQAYCLISNSVKEFSIHRRERLKGGSKVLGPAIVDEGVSTTVVHTGQSLMVDEYGNLIIEV
ncbi:MAG: hydantoinase/oxoprolinase family protein [Nitrososphaerales archaeon]